MPVDQTDPTEVAAVLNSDFLSALNQQPLKVSDAGLRDVFYLLGVHRDPSQQDAPGIRRPRPGG